MIFKPDDVLQVPKNVEFMERLLKTVREFKFFALVTSLIEIGFFNALIKPKSLDELARELEVDARLLRMICELLKNRKLVKECNGFYELTDTAVELLTSTSPYSQTTYLQSAKESVKLWLNLKEVIRQGRVRLNPPKFFTKRIHALAQHSLLGEVQKTVKIVSEFEEFKKAKKLLDLAGGHGLYAIAFTAMNRQLRAYVFDLPEVVEETKKYLKMFNADRVEVIAGDMFKDTIGKGYDIVFSSYNPGGKKAELLPKIRSALNKGGLFVNKQYFRENEEFPLIDLEWNLWEFEGVEKAEKAYTFSGDLTLDEYLNRLEELNFEILDVVNFNPEGAKMIIAKLV